MKTFLMCPICKGNSHKKFQENNFTLYTCDDCTLEFLYPFPSTKEIKKLYKKNYYFGQLGNIQGYTNYDSLIPSLEKEANKKLQFIRKYLGSSTNKHLLDVGSGTGIFLKIAREYGYLITGNDISSYAINKLKEENIAAIKGSITKNILHQSRYDIVTAWDVIEHIPNIDMAFKALYLTLKKDGYIFITTPDTNSIDSKIMKKKWYGYKKIPEHILFFNSKSIRKLLMDNNFEVLEIVRWGFFRDLEFLLTKLASYSPFFIYLKKIFYKLKIFNHTFFIPLTDCMIVARKKD